MGSVFLNKELEVLSGEKAIDLYSSGIGGYVGSLVVPKEHAERVAFVLRTAHIPLFNGKAGGSPIFLVKVRV